jgi:hypothetical protein
VASQLEEFSPQIDAILAGHLHLNWFHIKTLPNGKEIPMTGTPAISPIFFTDPGFKIYSYSPQTQKLNDFAIYRYSMEADQTWRKENDENTF